LPIIATSVLLLLHVPPLTPSLNVELNPAQILETPVIEAGDTIVVIVAVAALPHPVEYVIVAVPPTPPVTIPVAEPTVAIDVLLLLHVPPLVTSDNVVLNPAHTLGEPDMPPGVASVVIVVVAAVPQPVE